MKKIDRVKLINALEESAGLLQDSVNYENGDKETHAAIRINWYLADELKKGAIS